MQLWDKLAEYAKNFSSYRTTMDFGDVAEILIIAVLLYYTLVWMKTTRAWILLKGLIVILVFLLLAYFFRMTTILWMAQNVLGFAVTLAGTDEVRRGIIGHRKKRKIMRIEMDSVQEHEPRKPQPFATIEKAQQQDGLKCDERQIHRLDLGEATVPPEHMTQPEHDGQPETLRAQEESSNG